MRKQSAKYEQPRPSTDGVLVLGGLRAEAPPGAGALRLDYRTKVATTSSRAGINVIIRDYGEGEVEAGWSRVCGYGTTPGVKGRGRDPEANQRRAEQRAKAEIRRAVMAAGLDYLLSLTYREIVSIEQAWADLEAFVKRVHQVRRDWLYVVVIELQERGAPHFHLGVKGFQDVELLRRCWRETVGEGNIDVKAPPGQSGGQWKRARMAGYLSKYVSKDVDKTHRFGRHRYRTATGMRLPIVREYLPWMLPRKAYIAVLLLVRQRSDRSWMEMRLVAGDEVPWGYCRTFP